MKLALLGWIVLSGVAAALESRKWTDTAGRSFDGVLIAATADAVEVKRADGKAFKIQRTNLSKEDNAYLDAQKSAPSTVAKPVAPVAAANEKFGPGWKDRLAGYSSPDPDFTSPWPDDTKVLEEPKIDVVTEDEAEKQFIYESPHFRFESNCALRPSLVAKFAMMFEACYEVHKAVPLNNRRTRAAQAPKFRARIFETVDQYHQAGGLPNSNGVYMPDKDYFMVHLPALSVKKVGSGYMFDYEGDFHTLFHEVVHQLWADLPYLAGTWMVEGFAEYMSTMPYRNGRFAYTQHDKFLLEYATAYGKKHQGGRALGSDIVMPRLKNFMASDYKNFHGGPEQSKNYGRGLLMTYFFAELDSDCKRFRECFKAMQQGKNEEEARQVLLGGRTYEQLEDEVATAFRKKGIKMTFQ